jgi:hypothetical protein
MKKMLILIVLNTFFLDISSAQTIDSLDYKISLIALEYLKNNDLEGYKSQMDSAVSAEISTKTYQDFITLASKVLAVYEIPNFNSLLIESRSSIYKGKQINLYGIIFPFGSKGKSSLISDYQIVFIFSNDISKNKIVAFRIRDFISHY